MTILSEIEKIKEEVFGIIIIDLILFIAPGLTFIFYFSKELFLTIDVIKLILLSISFITPFLLVNFILSTILVEGGKSKGNKENVFISFSMSLLLSTMILYISLFVAYFLKFSFKTTLIWAIIFQLILILSFVWNLIKGHLKKS